MCQLFIVLFCPVRFFVWVSPLLLMGNLTYICRWYELEVLY